MPRHRLEVRVPSGVAFVVSLTGKRTMILGKNVKGSVPASDLRNHSQDQPVGRVLDAPKDKISWECPSWSPGCLVQGFEAAVSITSHSGVVDCEVGSWSLKV